VSLAGASSTRDEAADLRQEAARMRDGDGAIRDEIARIRDEAADVEDQAQEIRRDADAAREAAERLHELIDDFDRRTGDLMETAERQVTLWNMFDDCMTAAPLVIPDPAVDACFDEHLDPFETGLAAEVEAVEELQGVLDEAEAAVEVGEGG
jgi:hypothetical protein